MVWCRNCQHDNDQGAIFCSYCGQPMSSQQVTAPVEPSIGATVDLKRDYKPFETPKVVPDPPYIPNLPQINPAQPKQQHNDFFRFVFIVGMIFFGIPLIFRVLGSVFYGLSHMLPFLFIGGIIYWFSKNSHKHGFSKDIGMRIAAIIAVFMFIPHMWWLVFPILFIGGDHKGWSCQNHNKGPKQYKH